MHRYRGRDGLQLDHGRQVAYKKSLEYHRLITGANHTTRSGRENTQPAGTPDGIARGRNLFVSPDKVRITKKGKGNKSKVKRAQTVTTVTLKHSLHRAIYQSDLGRDRVELTRIPVIPGQQNSGKKKSAQARRPGESQYSAGGQQNKSPNHLQREQK